MPVEVFYSYAREDEALRDELEKHLSLLKRQGLIGAWHDRRISAGQNWASEIDAHAESADIILLLVSADFLASDYCINVEMTTALRRHTQGAAVVIPIILRPVDWSGAPFGHLQALPRDGKPVTSWLNRDEAFLQIAQGIRHIVSRAPSPAPDARPAPGGPQPHQQRVLDAAMPGRVVKDRTTELQTLIRLPESPGLKGILQADRDAEPRPEDVVSKPFPVTFPRSLGGQIEGFTAQVTLSGPDFAPPTQTKRFVVPPNQDSEVVTFLLTPQRTGRLKLLVELQWEEAVRGTRRLLTECVADASAITEPPPRHLVQMALAESVSHLESVQPKAPAAAVTTKTAPPADDHGELTASAPPPPAAPRGSGEGAPSKRASSVMTWTGALGGVAAVLLAGVLMLRNGLPLPPDGSASSSSTGGIQPSPAAGTQTLRVRVVDPATGVGLAAAKVVADTKAGPRVGQTDSEGYVYLTLPETDRAVRLTVSRDDYQSVEQQVVAVAAGSKEAAVVRLPRATPTVSDRVIWEKNWKAIDQPRPRLGSSGAGSRTDTASMMRMLNGLDLTTAPDLAQKRDRLVALVNQAQVNPQDPDGAVRYTPEMRAAETELKQAIRNRAVKHGAAVVPVQ